MPTATRCVADPASGHSPEFLVHPQTRVTRTNVTIDIHPAARYVASQQPTSSRRRGAGPPSEALAFSGTGPCVPSSMSTATRDPTKHQRQDVYLRALQTFPEISVHFGHFLTHELRAPLANPTPTQSTALSRKTEEKGSDVNLAVHLLNDACTTGTTVPSWPATMVIWQSRCALPSSRTGDRDSHPRFP